MPRATRGTLLEQLKETMASSENLRAERHVFAAHLTNATGKNRRASETAGKSGKKEHRVVCHGLLGRLAQVAAPEEMATL
jgi:hypothetical protein